MKKTRITCVMRHIHMKTYAIFCQNPVKEKKLFMDFIKLSSVEAVASFLLRDPPGNIICTSSDVYVRILSPFTAVRRDCERESVR